MSTHNASARNLSLPLRKPVSSARPSGTRPPLLWHALTTHPKHEAMAQTGLENSGFETYLPRHRVVRRWSDRKKTAEALLFPGYLFCRFARHDKLSVLQSPSVRSIVSVGRDPVPVDDAEIDSLRQLISTGRAVDVCPYIQVGRAVRIERGPFRSLRGVILRADESWRVVVSVEALGCSAAIELDADQLAPDRSAWAPQHRLALTASS